MSEIIKNTNTEYPSSNEIQDIFHNYVGNPSVFIDDKTANKIKDPKMIISLLRYADNSDQMVSFMRILALALKLYGITISSKEMNMCIYAVKTDKDIL